MPRDRRFVAAHRGGPLTLARHRRLAAWAARCAERVLPLFEAARPGDDRPRQAIAVARAWVAGSTSVGEARTAAVAALAAAREGQGAARQAARAAAHAVATSHMADHSIQAAAYAIRAADLAGRSGEQAWQERRLPASIRDLFGRS
jgi:hypothetical protein